MTRSEKRLLMEIIISQMTEKEKLLFEHYMGIILEEKYLNEQYSSKRDEEIARRAVARNPLKRAQASKVRPSTLVQAAGKAGTVAGHAAGKLKGLFKKVLTRGK